LDCELWVTHDGHAIYEGRKESQLTPFTGISGVDVRQCVMSIGFGYGSLYLSDGADLLGVGA
jgi:hypothetical protein